MKPKNMGSVEDLLDLHNNTEIELTADEKRLVDLINYEKTGKHLELFQKKEKSKAKSNEITILESTDVSAKATVDLPSIPFKNLDIANGSSVKMSSK